MASTISTALSAIMGKIGILSKKPDFWKVVVLAAVIAGLIVVYLMLSNSLAKEKTARGDLLKKNNEEFQKLLSDQKQEMEMKYAKDVEQANAKLKELDTKMKNIAQDRASLAQKMSVLEDNIIEIQKGRETIEKRTYTKSELDSKFTAILIRGSR